MYVRTRTYAQHPRAHAHVQLDKLLKSASSATVDDDLVHKPNLDALGSDDDDAGSDDGGDGGGGGGGGAAGKTGLYRPPKLAAVQYDEKKSAKAERDEERRRKRVMSSRAVRELKREFGDAPEEFGEVLRRPIRTATLMRTVYRLANRIPAI
jgi:hypothetical protein